jgi:outer membrane lipoprotein carrier protein
MTISMRGLLAASLLIASAVLSAAPAQEVPAPGALAQLIQAHYNSVTSFTAGFTHTFKGGLLPQTTVERGSVKIRKPGRMRWTYDAPNQKEFVADGTLLYSYVKADRTCYVSDLPKGDTASTAVLFLAGKGDLVRDFRAALSPNSPAGEWRVLLTPRTPQTEFTQLTIGVDPKTLKMLSMESVDADGGVSTFRFENLRENVSLADREFLFTPPKGVDVIR